MIILSLKVSSERLPGEVKMEIPDKILEAYAECARKYGDSSMKFPYGTTPDDLGGVHLELSCDGKMALVGIDRGRETERKVTYSIDELMYWIFKDKFYSRIMRRPHEDYNFEKLQRMVLDEMSKISPEWRERLRKEQESYR